MRKLKLITGKHSSAVIARMSEENKNKDHATLITDNTDTIKAYVELMQDEDLLIGSTTIKAIHLHNDRLYGFEIIDLGDEFTSVHKSSTQHKSRLATLDNLEKSGLCIMFKVLGHTAVMRFDDEEAQDEMFEKLI